METKLCHEFPQNSPMDAVLQQTQKIHISHSNDLCSFQLSPAFKSTYVKRKLNCPLQQKSKPQQSKHPPANYSLESIKKLPSQRCSARCPSRAATTAQGTLWAPGCHQLWQEMHHSPEIFHIPTIFHVPSELGLCEGKEKPPLKILPWIINGFRSSVGMDGGILDTMLEKGRAGDDELKGTGRIRQDFVLLDEQSRRKKESLLWPSGQENLGPTAWTLIHH